MATKIDNIDALDKILTCSICKKHYSEPKVFSCFHYYCKSCIAKLSQHNLLGCPTCRKEAEDVVGKEDELPSVLFISRLEDIYTMHKKAKSNEVKCEECGSGRKTKAFCKKCGKFICKKCVESHTLMKSMFKDHEVIPKGDIAKLLTKGFLHDALPVPKCSCHSEKLKLFCYECKKAVCSEDAKINHEDHTVVINTNAAQDEKLKLTEMLELLSETKGFFNDAVKKLESMEQKLDNHEGHITAAIETYFEELHALLEQTKTKRLQEVQEKVQKRKISLKEQKEELDMSKAQAERIECYTRQCIQYSSHYDLMRAHEDTTKIQQEVDDYHWEGRNKEVVEDMDGLGCSMKCEGEVVEIYDSLAKVGDMQVIMEFLEHPADNNAPRISVKLANGSCFKGNLLVQSQLKRKSSEEVNTLEVEKVGQGLYKIHMGTYPGDMQHELIITIMKNGLPLYTSITNL